MKENATVKEKTQHHQEIFDNKIDEELKILSSEFNRTKRQAPEFLTILRQTRCPLLLVADYRYLYIKGPIIYFIEGRISVKT